MTDSGFTFDCINDTGAISRDNVYATKVSPTFENGHVMSDHISSLASNIYQEFERMMKKYDDEVVKDLMPLVVAVLESLDNSCLKKHEVDVEMELLREDIDQLLNQLEKEKQLRKCAEEKLLEVEDRCDEDRKEMQEKQELMESASRLLELKMRNITDHSNRLEEKEQDVHREFNKLKDRYNELLRTHMEHVERSKHIISSTDVRNFGTSVDQVCQNKLASRQCSSTISNTSAGVILSYQEKSAYEDELLGVVNSTLTDEQLSEINIQPEILTNTSAQDIIETPFDLDDIDAPPQMDAGGLRVNIVGARTVKTCVEPNSIFDEDNFEEESIHGDEIGDGEDLDDEDNKIDDDRLGDDFGMHQEIENLINENAELIATKNALNVLKDDLIAKLDEYTCDNERLRVEYEVALNSKLRLKKRLAEVEDELKMCKVQVENLKKAKLEATEGDDDSIPMAQRKRFNRIEMARVLMERNQYKERLMELQEAVRWTEMIRASKEHPDLASDKEKKRSSSSVWNFFGLLSGGGGGGSTQNGTVVSKSENSASLRYPNPAHLHTPASQTLTDFPQLVRNSTGTLAMMPPRRNETVRLIPPVPVAPGGAAKFDVSGSKSENH